MTIQTTNQEVLNQIKSTINEGVFKLVEPMRPIQEATEPIHTTRRKMAMVFARQIMKHSGLSFGDSQSYAWDELKQLPNVKLLVFLKKDGTIAKRIVDVQWDKYYKVKGTGNPLKPGQILFADITRIQCGTRPLISTYKNRIIDLIDNPFTTDPGNTPDSDNSKNMTYYQSLIKSATNCDDSDLQEIENIMRDVIFKSTLDWQTKPQLEDAAKTAFEVLQKIKL